MRKRIAVFIDVDNTLMEYDRFSNIIGQIMMEGDITYGKLYGVSDRRNRQIIDYAADFGYEVAAASRIKRRVKGFDSRMLIDITELVVSNKSIHSVAIISYPADFVPLFSKLREYGIEVISLDDIDKASANLCDILISSKSEKSEQIGELGRLPYSGLESEEEGSIEELLVNAYGKSILTDEEGIEEDSRIFDVFDPVKETAYDPATGDPSGHKGENSDVLMERVKHVLKEIKEDNK